MGRYVKQRWMDKESSGIVMPLFSLWSQYGIGTMKKAAFEFVDWLESAGQHYWQVLPMNHTDEANCPYQCYSAVAGNPLFIDLDDLVERGLLGKDYLKNKEVRFSSEKVEYKEVKEFHYQILRVAFKNCSQEIISKVRLFCSENDGWIRDYSLFMALTNYYNKPLWEWDESIKRRDPVAMSFFERELKDDIEFYKFVQFIFFDQWKYLRAYASAKGIKIIGDIPFYPSPNSCDVWVNPTMFKVDKDLVTTSVAGIPPDVFSKTGQRWGNPVYDWEALKEDGFKWWIDRVRYTLKMFDIIRLDHFRAFQDYYEIPAEEETAVNGKWVPGPREELFNALYASLGEVPFIAEDLGIIGDDVRELLKKVGFPGMAVLVFAFEGDRNSLYLPHNWAKNKIGYTSTHDSETFIQMLNRINEDDRAFALNYIDAYGSTEALGFRVIRAAFKSPALLVMVMAPDLLSMGEEGRINVPGTVIKNWQWRTRKDAFNSLLAKKLREITETYKRA